MKIKRLEIKGYKSIEHLVLEDLPSLMVLAGANGAGKSNVVEALAFFGAVVRDGVNHAIKDFGGMEDIRPKNINNPESIGIVIQIKESNYLYEYHADISNKMELIEYIKINNDVISTMDYIEKLEKEAESMMQHQIEIDNKFNKLENNTNYKELREILNLTSNFLDKMKYFQDRIDSELSYSILKNIKNSDHIYKFLTNIKIFRIDPFVAKYPSRDIINSDELNSNGNNIAAILAKLEKDDDFRETLMEWLELIVPQMQQINASANRLDGSVGLSFTEASGKQFPAHLISDGTIYVICILTAILSRYNDYGITIIEEPERGIHPKAIGELIGFIRDKMAESGKHTVILTTHSESVVRNSEVEELFFVQQENGATQVKSLRDSNVDKNKIPLDTAWLTNLLGGGLPW